MMMKFCSLVKILTAHSAWLSQLWLPIATLIAREQVQICRAALVSSYTHTLNIPDTTAHSYTQI